MFNVSIVLVVLEKGLVGVSGDLVLLLYLVIVLLGGGEVFYWGECMLGVEVFKCVGLELICLLFKEGLVLNNGIV